MKYPSTEKIVDRLVKNYRDAGKAMAKAQARNGELSSWMSQSTFDDDADQLYAAFQEGKFENVNQDQLNELFEKYDAQDIYRLTASYFNKTGKILNLN